MKEELRCLQTSRQKEPIYNQHLCCGLLVLNEDRAGLAVEFEEHLAFVGRVGSTDGLDHDVQRLARFNVGIDLLANLGPGEVGARRERRHVAVKPLEVHELIKYLGVLRSAEHVKFVDMVLAMLFNQLPLELGEVQRRQRFTCPSVDRRLSLQDLMPHKQ